MYIEVNNSLIETSSSEPQFYHSVSEMSKLGPVMLAYTQTSFSVTYLIVLKYFDKSYMHRCARKIQYPGNWYLKGHTQADSMYGPAVGSHCLEPAHNYNTC